MRRIIAILAGASLLSFMRLAQGTDEQEVRAVIDQYFRGHGTGDPAEMRKAFWPTAHIEGIRDGKFSSWTVEEYCSRFNLKEGNTWKIANKVYSSRPTG